MAYNGVSQPVTLALNPETGPTGQQDTYRAWRTVSTYLTQVLLQLFNLQTYLNSGYPLVVKEGANQSMGTATLASGTVTVFNSSVMATTNIFLTAQETGAFTGNLRVSARAPGVSFTISSSVNTDSALVAWLFVQPA